MSDNELKVIVKAKELAVHSFRLTSNCNRYPKKYRHSLVDRIQLKSLDLYETLLEANRINNVTRKWDRCEAITKAITICDELLFYIELSMNLELLADNSAAYWSKMVSDVKYMSIAWRTRYNISHPQLKDIIHYHFGYDADICWLCDLFVDSTEGKGISLGNQINQGFALLYLDGMDKLIKHELGIEYYGRYMDDFYLIHPSKDYLKHCLEVIKAYLETLDLELNGKTQIFPFKNGVSYLGFHTYVAKDGHAVRRLKNQNKRNAKRKFTRMAKLVAEGKLPPEKFQTSYGAWKNHISHGDCYGMGKKMDERIRKTGGN